MSGRDKNLILIVDNAAEMREALTAILGEDYRISDVSDGGSALRAASSNRPDMILLNPVLPDMDGFAVCERIKEQEGMKDVLVIFISARNEMPDKIRALQTGADYVAKPIHPGEVRAKVAAHLTKRKLQLDSERRNKKLRKRCDDLTRMAKLKNDLTHIILHDMRTPVSAISMGLFLLAESGANLGRKEREYLEMAQSASQELSGLINEYLDVVRLESGNTPLRLEQQDVKTLAEQAVESLRSRANSGGITLRITGDQAIGRMVDPALIHRVFEKLVETAMSYAPRGGDVEIAMKSGPAALRTEVRTTGGDLAGENERIFGKFSQLSLQAEKHSGGLGFEFCRLAIEAHQGRIGVTGEKETGGAFWFELPVGDARQTGEDS